MSKELQIVWRCDNKTCDAEKVAPYSTPGGSQDPIPVGWCLIDRQLFCCQAHIEHWDLLNHTFQQWWEKDCPERSCLEAGLVSARERLFAAFLVGYRFRSLEKV